jgi:hypothetical protein
VREQFGGDIVYTFQWELQLVQLLRRMSRPGEAASEMRRLFDAARAALGEDNAHVLKLEVSLARTLLEAGTDLEDSERRARHAAQGLAGNHRHGRPQLRAAEDTLHCVIRARGRANEAAALARDLLCDVSARGIF